MDTSSVYSPKKTRDQFLQSAKELAPFIRQHSEQERINRRLSRPVFDALKEAGFYRMYLPESLGGFEADPVTVARVVEEIATHNSAAGWSIMVANTTAWECCNLSEKGVEEIYRSGPDTFMASAFHPPKNAVRVVGGYMINGRGPLFSNVHEGQWIFVTAFVMENGQLKFSDGHPEIIGAFLKPGECEIIDTWYTIGMNATDSNDVAFKDVFVPDHLVFPLVPEFQPSHYYSGRLYRYAVVGIAITSLIAPVALALGRNAINELKMLAGNKTPMGSMVPIREKGSVQRKLGEAEGLVQSSRAYLYHTLETTWNKTWNGEMLTIEEKGNLLLAGVYANQSCFKAVDMMYAVAGSSAIYTRSKLSQYFTDAQVLRQHGFLNESRYETVAQIMLNVPLDLPVVAF